MRATDLAAGTLRQFISTGDRAFLDNSDPDELREMVALLVQSSDQYPEDPHGCYCPPSSDECDGLCHHPRLRSDLPGPDSEGRCALCGYSPNGTPCPQCGLGDGRADPV